MGHNDRPLRWQKPKNDSLPVGSGPRFGISRLMIHRRRGLGKVGGKHSAPGAWHVSGQDSTMGSWLYKLGKLVDLGGFATRVLLIPFALASSLVEPASHSKHNHRDEQIVEPLQEGSGLLILLT